MKLNNVQDLRKDIEKDINDIIDFYKDISYHNQNKILNSFIEHNVSDFHFNPSTGYGYGDIGRDVLEDIFADVFGGEDALVRPQIVSGTHAISLCLTANLKHGDELVSIGEPYDTLQKIIGKNNSLKSSLMNRGITYNEAPLNSIENNNINNYVNKNTKMVLLQRSRGYQERKTLTIKDIESAVRQIKNINSNIIVFVDNCYGEFVETREPCEVGADLIAGSLIKNPGGGLAPTGGYITGKRNLIEKIADELLAPGLGKDIGASSEDKRVFYQGLYMSPHIVLQALETAIFASMLFDKLDYSVDPKYNDNRGDIIQAITFNDKEKLLKFCELVQKFSPVNSQLKPEPDQLPGYDEQIIMAAGTFVQGSSIELSVDAPVKEPYIAYLQGSLTSESAKNILLQTAYWIKNSN